MEEKESVIKRVGDAFEWIESRDMRVGQVWLNPKQAKELHGQVGFDPAAQMTIIEHYRSLTGGATLVGYMYGAMIFESEQIKDDHVALFPDDWNVQIIPGAGTVSGCMPL